MSNSDLILAGTAAGGDDGTSLAWFAMPGATGPVNTTDALDAAFLSAGLCSEDGLTAAVKEDSNDIGAFGLFVPARTIVTSSVTTFKLTMLESNPVSLAVYNRKALTAIVPDSGGAFSFATGKHARQRMAGVFDIVDDNDHLRAYCPAIEVTDRDDIDTKKGDSISYGVTLTAFPDSQGNAIYWMYKMGALAS